MFRRKRPKVQIECHSADIGLRYLLYLPSRTMNPKEGNWPLILYLHGIGERGGKLSLLLKHGIPKVVESQIEFPFIAVSPQCPNGTMWFEHYDALKDILDEVIDEQAVDEKRIYLTGNSMGGYGAWGLGITFPKLFAAIAPICGGGEPEDVCVLRDVPIWAFHGERDDIVKLDQGQSMVEALKDCGGKVRFTVYKGVGHDSWTRTYQDPELYRWFLRQSRM